MDVCIKNIDEEEWRTFKAESAKHGIKMGDLFNKMVEEHTTSCERHTIDRILHGPKPLKGILTQDDFRLIRSQFRKNFLVPSR